VLSLNIKNDVQEWNDGFSVVKRRRGSIESFGRSHRRRSRRMVRKVRLLLLGVEQPASCAPFWTLWRLAKVLYFVREGLASQAQLMVICSHLCSSDFRLSCERPWLDWSLDLI
jgi:hypothetical protein